jgi:hypothetical protein
MGSTTVTVPDEVYTAASRVSLKKRPTNMKNIPAPFFEDAMAHKATVTGGSYAHIPNEFEEHSRPTRLTLATAMQFYDTYNQPTMKSGKEDWAALCQPAWLSLIERNIMRGQQEQINLAVTRVNNVRTSLARQGQKAWLIGPASSTAGAGTWAGVPAWDDWMTVNGTDFSTGLIEEVSDGNNTVHGISRSSYPVATYPLFHPIVSDGAGAASTNFLGGMADIQSTYQIRNGGLPDGFSFYCSAAFSKNVARIQRGGIAGNFAQMQYATQQTAEQAYGMPSLLGKPMKIVEQMPSTGTNTVTKKWSCVGISWGVGIQLQMQAGSAFDMMPWETIPGTAGVQSCLFVAHGQLCMLEPSLNMLLVDYDTY